MAEKINTKYEKGDKVFALIDLRIWELEILEYYDDFYFCENVGGVGKFDMHETELFPSKQALKDFINNQ